MRDRIGERLQPLLAIGNFFAEKVLVVAVKRLPIQIFVARVSNRHGRARQNLFIDPLAQALLLAPGCLQSGFDRAYDAFDALTVGVLIPLRRADP